MKVCPNCQNMIDDNAAVCGYCGTPYQQQAAPQDAAPQYAPYPPVQNGYAPQVAADPFDHTAEFDPKDISDNKVVAMLVYLFGTVGIIIAFLGSSNSPFVAFHVRQALKILVVSILLMLGSLLLCWTFIVPIFAMVMSVVLAVVKIICFFQICSGKAKEPAVVRKLGFLK